MAITNRTRSQVPSMDQIHRAIYMDFEGYSDQLPAFCGVQIESEFKQVVFDPSLVLAAQYKRLEQQSFDAFAYSLAETARMDNRLIVAYSQYEVNVIKTFAGVDISACYVDAHKLAKYWKNKCHHGEPIEGWGLKDFLAFIGYKRGQYLGEQKSTKRIRAVSTMLEKRGSYESLTPTVKAQWTKVLEHNRIDVQGMKELVLVVGKELLK